MKVDVIQAKDIAFKRFCWWSDWIDVSVIGYAGDAHLLQMKVSRFNAKKFSCITMKSSFRSAAAKVSEIGSLTQMSTEKGNE